MGATWTASIKVRSYRRGSLELASGRCAGLTRALLAAGTILQDCKIGRNRLRRLPPEGRGHRRGPSQPGRHCFSAVRVFGLGGVYKQTGALGSGVLSGGWRQTRTADLGIMRPSL